MTLGTRLRALRSSKGLSLRQVARKTGISASTLSRLERDMSMADTNSLSALAEFYNVSFAILLDVYEPTDEQVNAFLVGHGYNLEQLRVEINELIDKLQEETRAILAQKEQS